MLTDLSIRNIAIIAEAELSFQDGLTVMTGETGAGKSIAVDALALALGSRASFDVVRAGAEQADVIARFELAADAPAQAWLVQQNLQADQECILRRTLDRKGSRAFINGRPVPVQTLRDLGDLLVEIHGQHEHQLLLRGPVQRDLLDAYAGHADQVAALAHDVRALAAASERLQQRSHGAAAQAARRELLVHELKELTALGLSAAGIAELEQTHRRAAHAQEVAAGLEEIRQRLAEDAGALPQLVRSSQKLQSLAAVDPLLATAAERLQGWAVELEDLLRELRALDAEPPDQMELEHIERTIAEVERLARKHRVVPGQLSEVHDRLNQELQELQHLESGSGDLERAIENLTARTRLQAAALSGTRQTAAINMGREVSARLPALGMPEAELRVVLLPLETIAPHGQEDIEFHVSTNRGQPFKPLTRVASGGELSRISLALQVVLAEIASVPTLIFDEVDVGIGGGVAEIVGRELRALAARRQVLCITHLAQVAAYGSQHYRVHKRGQHGNMATMIDVLEGEPRVTEVARMLGGIEETKASLALASDMLRRGAG